MNNKEKVLNTLKNIRNKSMENNAFFLPNKWVELIEQNEYVLNDELIGVLKKEDGFDRLYFSARSKENLKGIAPFIKNHSKQIITDILSIEPYSTGAFQFLCHIGFEKYSTFLRMNAKRAVDVVGAFDGISFADERMLDDIYQLMTSAFDPINSYLPSKDEIKKAVKHKEIIYIGTLDIKAFAFFEQTTQTTVTCRYIFVRPEYRKQNLARRLMEFGMRKGKTKYLLWVDSENEPAQALYRKHGYDFDGLQDVTLIYRRK